MNKSFITLLVAVAFVISVSGAVFAGSGSDLSMMDTDKSGTLFHQSQRVSKLIGTEVLNIKGETLGKIDDLITAEDGRVSYLIIAKGGVMGLGAKLVPVPIAQVSSSLDSNGKCVIDIEKTVFDKAPGFASNEWPDVSSQEWQAETRGYFSNEGNLPPAAMPGEKTEKSMGSDY